MKDPLYGPNLAYKFGVESVSTLLSGMSEDFVIAATDVERSHAGPILSPLPHDAIAVVVQLRPFVGRVWISGKLAFAGRLNAGSLSVLSLRQEMAIECSGPCHMVIVYLSQYTLERICPKPLSEKLRSGGPEIFTLRHHTVAHGLIKSLMPSIARPDLANDTFVSNILRALILYCVRARSMAQQTDTLIVSVPTAIEEADLPDLYVE